MKGYYVRLAAAFALLKVASSLMKDAEKLLVSSMEAKDAAARAEIIDVTAYPVVGEPEPEPQPEDESPTEDENG